MNKKNTNYLKSQIQMTSHFKNHQQIVDRINSIEGITWKARVNRVFANKTILEINKLSGRQK